MQPYVGQILAVGFDYAPIDWALCDGSLLPIPAYQALFAVIGNAYGGDGTTNFALPDLRGRVPVGSGMSPGQPPYTLGQSGGAETVGLSAVTEPVHTHALMTSSKNGTLSVPSSATAIAINATETTINVFGNPPGTTTLSQAAISTAPGNAQPHENRQPFITINYIIATNGIFPTT